MTDETNFATGSLPSVRKYTGPTREHPLMLAAIKTCDNPAFAVSLCDFIDRENRAGVKGPDIVDTLRVVSGTLCDMQWMLKD